MVCTYKLKMLHPSNLKEDLNKAMEMVQNGRITKIIKYLRLHYLNM
jgi:hypothetical protein